MSNVVEPQITETKPSLYGDFIKNKSNFSNLEILGQSFIKPSVERGNGEPYVFLKDFSFIYSTSDGSIGSNMVNYKKGQVVFPFPLILPTERRILEPAFKDALDKGVLVPQKTAQQQAMLQEVSQMNYSGLTDKVFGKSKQGAGLNPQRLRVVAYIIVGAVVGRYVAKNIGKSTTLGMIVGGLAPLLVLKLTMEYDKKNMPKQEPRQKVGMNPDGSIMTEKQIQNAQVSSDISKFIPQNKPKLGNQMPIDWSTTLFGTKKCPNGTKKVTVPCLVAPCPEMEVCA